MEISRRLAMALPTTTTLEVDLYLAGERSAPVAACMRPAGGNGVLIVGDKVDLEPGVWQRGLKLTFPQEALAKAAGGPDQPLNSRDLGLVITPARGARSVILIDHLKINGKLTGG
jgi:hypothetical protein